MEDLLIPFQVRPEDRPGRIEVQQWNIGIADAIIERPPVGPVLVAQRQGVAVIEGIHMGRDAELLQIVRALGPSRGLPDLLHRRQKQADQYGDDRDHHEQFHKRECRTTGRPGMRVSRSWRVTPGFSTIVLFVTTR